VTLLTTQVAAAVAGRGVRVLAFFKTNRTKAARSFLHTADEFKYPVPAGVEIPPSRRSPFWRGVGDAGVGQCGRRPMRASANAGVGQCGRRPMRASANAGVAFVRVL